jgi:hypothetical protein
MRSYALVETDIEIVDTNTVHITTSTAIDLRIVVIG